MTDVARALASEAIPRLRFGIGRPTDATPILDWVLAPFPVEEESGILPAAFARAADAIGCAIELGWTEAMSRFNAQG